MSLARQRQRQARQRQQASVVVSVDTEGKAEQYRAALGKLHKSQQMLKMIADLSERSHTAVVEILPNHLGYVRHWLAAGNTHQNDVLTQCVVWVVDGGEWKLLLELAEPAVRLKMPLHWMRRSLAEFVADGVFRAAEAVYKVELRDAKRKPSSVPDDSGLFAAFWWVLEKLDAAEHGWADANNVIKARYHKLGGLLRMADDDAQAALRHFTAADQLYPNIAVKGKITDAENALALTGSLSAQPPQPLVTEPGSVTETGDTG